MGVQLFDQSGERFGLVDMLMHTLERAPRDGFKADAQHEAAAFRRQFQHAFVLRELGSDASLPSNAAPL